MCQPQPHPQSWLQRQLGYYMFSVSVALLAASIALVGSARSSVNAFNYSIGKNLGNQLQTVTTGLDAYIQNNYAELLKDNPSINGVVNAKTPTVVELQSLNYLSTAIQPTPSLGTRYVTAVSRTPAGCTPTTCKVIGAVYTQDPISGPNGITHDIRLLSAAADASPYSQIGFSRTDANAPKQAHRIYFPTGATENNPDANKRAGILYGSTERITVAADKRFWLAPVDTPSSLPAANNNFGDGRLVKSNSRPYIYDGVNLNLNNGWKELFSSGLSASNISIGQGSGFERTNSPSATMLNNVFVGMNAGSAAGSTATPLGPAGPSSNNTFIGSEAGKVNTGNANVFVGKSAGSANAIGKGNTFMGMDAGKNTVQGNDNLFMGYQAGLNASGADGNVFLGAYSGTANTTGQGNVFTGSYSGNANTTGSFNVFTGNNAGQSNTTGSRNVYTGYQAGNKSTGSHDNVFQGYAAGLNNTASQNVFLGSSAGTFNTTGADNTFIGTSSGSANTTGFSNTFIGSGAGLNNKTGSSNVYIGSTTGGKGADTSNNVYIGAAAGFMNTTGVGNTAIGVAADAGRQTGDNNTAIGKSSVIGNGVSNATVIGYWASNTESNSVRIGNPNIQKIGGAVPWSTVSDRRLKTDIKDSPRGLAFVRQLRPVDYTLIESIKSETGFIAQEVEAVDPSFPGVNKPKDDTAFYSVAYTDFIPSIVKAIQELDAKSHPQAALLSDAQTLWAVAALLCVLSALVAVLLYVERHLYKEVNALKHMLKVTPPLPASR